MLETREESFHKEHNLYHELKCKVELTEKTRDIFLKIIGNNYTRHLTETIDEEDKEFFKPEKIDNCLIKNYGDFNYLNSDQIYSFLKSTTKWLQWKDDFFNYRDYSLYNVFNQDDIQILLLKVFFKHYISLEDLKNITYETRHGKLYTFIHSRDTNYDFLFKSPVRISQDIYSDVYCGMWGCSMGCRDPENCLKVVNKNSFERVVNELKEHKNLYDFCEQHEIELHHSKHSCEPYILCNGRNGALLECVGYPYKTKIPDYVFKYLYLDKTGSRYFEHRKILKDMVFDETMDKKTRMNIFDNLFGK